LQTIKIKPKTVKEQIRQIIKRPKEKFLTNSQEAYWNVLDKNQITFCYGPAGTGKSHVSIKKSIDLLWEEDNKYEKIVILRPLITVSNKNIIGSLPGTLMEKLDPYIFPSYYLIDKLIGKKERNLLIENNILEILAISFCRGINFDNSIVVIEESQNITKDEMKLLLTRIGFCSKMFFSGDMDQSDLFKDIRTSGFYDVKERLKGMRQIGFFEFSNNDIVRNDLIGEILERYNN